MFLSSLVIIVRMTMVDHLLIKSGVALTPENLEHLKKERKSHTDVVDICFLWISNVMKAIVAEMRHYKYFCFLRQNRCVGILVIPQNIHLVFQHWSNFCFR